MTEHDPTTVAVAVRMLSRPAQMVYALKAITEAPNSIVITPGLQSVDGRDVIVLSVQTDIDNRGALTGLLELLGEAVGSEGAITLFDGQTGIADTDDVLTTMLSKHFATRRCRVCGCTDAAACEGGCSWVEADLCSACKGKAAANG